MTIEEVMRLWNLYLEAEWENDNVEYNEYVAAYNLLNNEDKKIFKSTRLLALFGG